MRRGEVSYYFMTEIRRKARQRRREIGIELDAPVTAEAVIGTCLSALGLEREFAEPEDAILAGAIAVLDLPMGLIVQDGTRTLPEQSFDAAHEIAHVWLHRDSAHGSQACTPADVGADGTGEVPGSALSKVDGYSPQQRREREANEFAAELLLPGPLAHALFFGEGLTSAGIAAQLGLPPGVAQAQLADALLLPPLPDTEEDVDTPGVAAVALDEFQRQAAEAPCGPLLVGAGPGTGKTKTLVGRCRFLTQSLGIPAERYSR